LDLSSVFRGNFFFPVLKGEISGRMRLLAPPCRRMTLFQTSKMRWAASKAGCPQPGMTMAKDKIFLITPGFSDPAQPGETFVCPSCNQVEGLLASFPALAANIEVERVAFQRPRQPVVALLGEANQSLPLLLLADDAPADASTHEGLRFVNDTKRILALLAERHGFPKVH
jgi:hypothetical protein